ncbi:hypothetical protein PCANC_16786 [Puccinia coronata f. sp. avenae]|uniref:Uncharacterized protein n=1 Tax=Puccinia coronata f. sp. avenae TaxID=200324 RepID=A0A2N5UP21_9BASI|nr:hypothetical protein PCANC_16786 [Puccinia coronata f. sp. avenae]
MLATVNSVKDFEPSKELKTFKMDKIPDGRIWPEQESLNVDWENLIQQQENFLKSRSNNLPVTHGSNQVASASSEDSSEQQPLILKMATNGVHTIQRKGLGNQPLKENLFYVAKQSHSSRIKN